MLILAAGLNGINEGIRVNVEIGQRRIGFANARGIQSAISGQNPSTLHFEEVEEIRAGVDNRVVDIIRVDYVVISLDRNKKRVYSTHDQTKKLLSGLRDRLSRQLVFRIFSTPKSE